MRKALKVIASSPFVYDSTRHFAGPTEEGESLNSCSTGFIAGHNNFSPLCQE